MRETLQRRFDMAAWFKRHGFPVDRVAAASLQAAEGERRAAEALCLPWGQAPTQQQLEQAALSVAGVRAAGPGVMAPPTPPLHELPPKLPGGEADPTAPGAQSAAGTVPMHASSTTSAATGPTSPRTPFSEWLLLASFDRTLVDFSPVERVVEALAPELLPSLVGQGSEPGGDALPLTNSLLEEMQRRGVSRDQLLAALQVTGRLQEGKRLAGGSRGWSKRSRIGASATTQHRP